MTLYSVQPIDIFFAKNTRKSIGKNMSENLNGKYSRKILYHPQQSSTDVLKTASKRAIQKQQKKLNI